MSDCPWLLYAGASEHWHHCCRPRLGAPSVFQWSSGERVRKLFTLERFAWRLYMMIEMSTMKDLVTYTKFIMGTKPTKYINLNAFVLQREQTALVHGQNVCISWLSDRIWWILSAEIKAVVPALCRFSRLFLTVQYTCDIVATLYVFF